MMHTVSQQASSPSKSQISHISWPTADWNRCLQCWKHEYLFYEKRIGTSFLVLAVMAPADGKQSTWAAAEITVICEQATAAALFTSALWRWIIC